MTQRYLINGEPATGLSPLDRGLAYGDGVFRTLVASGGEPQHWALQHARLSDDCRALGIDCPDADTLLADIHRLVRDGTHAVIKIVVTRGVSDRGYAMPVEARPTRIVIRSDYPAYAASCFNEGVRLRVCRMRLAPQPQLAGIKHLNRLENVLARAEWNDDGIAEGILLDIDGHVIEGTMSNILLRTGSTLATPDLRRCGVAGLTRQRILDAAPELGCRPVVTELTLDDLLRADEVMICNSVIGVWQVRAIDDRRWPQQPLAGRLREFLRE